MTPEENAQELSYKFDIYYNSITSNQAPGLSEYEKSVFLTRAQDEILKNYFNPKGNKYQEGFDGSEKRQIDFSVITNTFKDTLFSNPIFDPRVKGAKAASLPPDVMLIINERAKVRRSGKDVYLTVVPISFDEYDRLMSKPYKRPLKNQAWRLLTHNSSLNQCDLIMGPEDTLVEYDVRYIRQPKPIIVGDTDGLTINGYTYGTGTNQTQGCELDPILHEEILQRAVELAKAAWITTGQENLQALMQVGQRSE